MIPVALFVACGEAQMSIPSSLKSTDQTASEIQQLRNQIVKNQRRIQELELRIESMLELHNNGEKNIYSAISFMISHEERIKLRF